MSIFPRLALIPLAAAFAGLGLALPASAQTTSETSPDPCPATFGADTNPNLQLATDPPPRSDARPGQSIHLSASWTLGSWDSLDSARACVEVANTVDPDLGGVENPTSDDGVFNHVFTIPAGLFNGTVICTRMRLAGDPAGPETAATWVSKQACFEVHPEETGAPPPTSTAPPAPTTTTAPPNNPAPAPPAPAAPPRTAPAPTTPAPTAPPSAPMTPFAAPDAPTETTAGNPGSPGTGVPQTRGRPAAGTIGGSGPIPLPLLPATGLSGAGLAHAGLLALAAGLPALALGRRRSS